MSVLALLKGTAVPLLGVALGSAAALAVVGTTSEEHNLLERRLSEFRRLDPDQQKMVKASFAEFSIQTEDRKREIIALHQAVEADPELRGDLERYFHWWSSLSQSEWESFPGLNRSQQIAFAKTRINKPTGSERTIVVDFAGWGQTSLQQLHLTIDECTKIIEDSLNGAEIPPEVADEMQQLQSPEHRALAHALWLFELLRTSPNSEILALQSENIRKAVMANVSDEPWKMQFQQIVAKNSGKSFFRFWMFQNLLVIYRQSTMALGNRLMEQFPVSEDEIVSAFVSLSDKTRQHNLMVMPSVEARTRLEFLAQANRKQTPEQKLLVKFIAFARERQRVIGAITFRLGNQTPRTGDVQPPSRDGDGR